MNGGYIQAEILGRQRGLKFGSLAAENIITELGGLMEQTGTTHYTGTMMASIVWWGLYNNAYVKREILDLTFEEVVDWVDENFHPGSEHAEKLTQIAKTWEESRSSKLVLENLQKTVDELKKNLASRKEKETTEQSTSPHPEDGSSSAELASGS